VAYDINHKAFVELVKMQQEKAGLPPIERKKRSK
jgi:hypothetical protein